MIVIYKVSESNILVNDRLKFYEKCGYYLIYFIVK